MKVGDNIPVTGVIPPPVQTIVAQPSSKTPPPPPEAQSPAGATGAWTLGEGRDGLQGAATALRKAIPQLTNLPAHWRTALLEAVDASLEGTDHNYVTIHANGNAVQLDGRRHTIVMLDIQTTKKLL